MRPSSGGAAGAAAARKPASASSSKSKGKSKSKPIGYKVFQKMMQTRLSSSRRPTQGRMVQIIGDMNALLLITFSGVFVLDLLHSFLIQHLVPLDHPTSTLSASYTVLQYFIDLLVFVGAMCHVAPSQLPWASAIVGLAL